MANKSWTFKIEDGDHTVQVEHNIWSGKRTVLVDGKVLAKETRIIDSNSDYMFDIQGHKGLVKIRPSGLAYGYDVAIDGKSVTTGKPALPAVPLPPWGWIFVVLCLLIPIVSLGGAIPGGIGAAGAFLCITIAKDASKATRDRVLLCLGVTLLCWVIFIVFVWSVSGALIRR